MSHSAIAPQSKAGWAHFPHDADVGVEGWGATVAEAFEQAAHDFTAVVTLAEVRRKPGRSNARSTSSFFRRVLTAPPRQRPSSRSLISIRHHRRSLGSALAHLRTVHPASRLSRMAGFGELRCITFS